MKNLIKELTRLDRLAHFAVNGMAFFIINHILNIDVAVVACMAAPFIKEVFDSRVDGNKFDILDLLMSYLGMGVALLVYLSV